MKPSVWAVITGNFRQEFELYTTIAYLCEFRSKGVIDGIVISTWEGEVEKVSGLKQRLDELGIFLVETPALEEDTVYSSINYLRQSTQLKSALSALPEGAFVLKCRTDYSNYDLNRIDNIHEGINLVNVNEFGDFDAGMDYKIGVLRFGVTTPFTFHDITYMGTKNDLRRLCSLDNSLLSVGYVTWVDMWIFATYFVKRYTVFEDFYRFINSNVFISLMVNITEEKEFILPLFLNKFYALYFVVLYQCFYVYDTEVFPENEKLGIEDIFRGKEGMYLRQSWLIEIRNDEIVKRIVLGELAPSKAYDALYSEIEKIRKKGYAESLSMTYEDYEELERWGRDYFGVEPKEWLYPYNKVSLENQHTESFDESAKILFSRYKPDDECMDAIKQIAHCKQSYYGEVIKHLDTFEKSNKNLYKKALFNSARYTNEDVIDKIAVLLYEEDLTEEEREEAMYPFVRYGHEDRLYSFPLTEKRIHGLLTYCMYEEKEQLDTGIRDFWYKGMVSYYGLNEFPSEPEEEVTVEMLNKVLEKVREQKG